MKKKILIPVSLALCAYLVSRHSGTISDSATRLLPALPFATQTIPHEEESKALASAPAREAEKLLRHAYLDASLDAPSPKTKHALATLAAGLSSADEEHRRKSAIYVESLLVEVVFGRRAVHPENQMGLSVLTSLYKARAKDQIHRMEKANPASPVLAYLQRN